MVSDLEVKIQDLVDNWWIESNDIKRGSLIEAFVPHVDQIPYQFEPIGRTDPKEHDKAEVLVKPLKIGEALQKVPLPVAGMPRILKHEYWSAYRAKTRPCLVLSGPGDEVDKALTRKMPNNSTAPTLIVIPYYGISQGQKRAGYNPLFVERVRHITYKQFFYDELPHTRGEPSILRFDHILSIGAHTKSYKPLGYRLGDEALEIVNEYLQWNILGGVEHDAFILEFKELVSVPQ